MDRAKKWDERKRAYLSALAERGIRLTLVGRRGARWARGASGIVAVLGASQAPGGDRWWLSLSEKDFRQRNALGAILLCEAEDRLLDFTLPAVDLDDLLPRLGADARGERKLNVVQSGDRYVLQIPSAEPLDITARLGDLAWLGTSSVRAAARPTIAEAPREANAGDGADVIFFARVRGRTLEPLDPVALPDGEVVVVRARRAPGVPAHAALRRLVAAGGPTGLPRDFAAQHDHHAHGAPRD